MSVADHEQDEPDYCPHGNEKPCWQCEADIADLYSEMKIQDAKEGH